jgi:hypothetical protein
LKSDLSDHLELVQAIYIDACAKCIADVSDLRDLKTIRSRVEDEGDSFLTITLPNFCNDFERSLAVGSIDSSAFRSFRKAGSIPAFLQGMISLIFDRETGRIRNEDSITNDHSTLVDSVRQICLAFKKTEAACTPKRVRAAIANFTAIEQSFHEFTPPPEDSREFSLVSSVLWGNILANIRLDMLVPRHGPGATAERVSGNQKFLWRRWHDRLEPYFPLVDNGYSMSAEGSEELKIVTIVPEQDEQPVRVTPVPKTMKGPRIIAIEPACMQYTQQAIRQVLYDLIESSELTKGHVNFRDQSVNQMLAIKSSETGQLATIDLSDASDRVPRSLALEMFRSNPDLLDAIDACRSTKAELPEGGVISPLLKFASMGSALCFPVESMYFYTICVAALLRAQNFPVTFANCFRVSRHVHVYGDDIIVPSTYAMTVLDYLQKYNCKVNSSKTFFSGNFRESCGADAYRGELVTPVYIRKKRPKNRQQVSNIISWSATAALFYKKGYWRTAELMWKHCERILGTFPYVSETSSGLGRISFMGYRSVGRWNNKLHRFEVKAWSPKQVYRTDKLEGYGALQKSLLSLESKDSSSFNSQFQDRSSEWFAARGSLKPTSSDESHLERSALYGAVALQLRWLPAT